MSKKQAQFKKVDTWIDIVKNEHEVLDFWKSADIFNKLRSRNKGGKKWSFLDGPMTANNPMGVHHAWGRTLKDAFQRYHAMNGFDETSCPMVVVGPCPGITCVLGGSRASDASDLRIEAMLPPGKSVRPHEPAKRVSPERR